MDGLSPLMGSRQLNKGSIQSLNMGGEKQVSLIKAEISSKKEIEEGVERNAKDEATLKLLSVIQKAKAYIMLVPCCCLIFSR